MIKTCFRSSDSRGGLIQGMGHHALSNRVLAMVLPMAALIAICAPSATGQAMDGQPLSHWSFDHDSQGAVLDSISGNKDPAYGNIGFVGGVSGKAIKLDGFRSHVHRASHSASPEGAFTVESWVALAGYPWSWAPIIDSTTKQKRGLFLGIGPEGQVKFRIAAGSLWHEATTRVEIPLRKWTHVAAVCVPNERITVYIDGEQAAEAGISGNFIPAPGLRRGSLTLGRNNTPQTWHEYQLTTENTHFYLDGLLDEVKVTNKAKTADEVKSAFKAVKNVPVPELSDRSTLPTGPPGNRLFGAFHTRLDYYEEWDAMWRVSDKPDIFIRFDDSPVQLVFWRGASFVPCWVNERGIWYTNEWLETWGRDVVSCAEPIMDRHCRYSHVRMIENTDARVVVHWRYALNDAFYTQAAISDDGRGEWCDEYHIIYPDQIGVRRMELHYSKPERKHDWVEQIVVLPPGKHPDEAVAKSAVSLINMKGDVHDYSWHDKDLKKEMLEPQGANISLVNMKSDYRPFIVVPPGPVKTVEGTWDSPFFRTYAAKMASAMRPDPVPSVYGWWDHWPVAQVPGDGRWVTKPNRPSHFTLTTFVQWNDHERTERTRTRIMLQGMTRRGAAELVPVAKSWLSAPTMTLAGEAFRGGSYDTAERAYLIEKNNDDKPSALECTLAASAGSPLLNPALIIKNWGDRKATLSIDGEIIEEGRNFKQGIRKGATGNDLIAWIRLESEGNIKLVLK